MATEQLDLAIEQLSAGNGAGPPEEAIHETRKALKRLRTMAEDARSGARRAGRRPGDGLR